MQPGKAVNDRVQRMWRGLQQSSGMPNSKDNQPNMPLKCGETMIRNVQVTPCTTHCHRRYMIYIPTMACQSSSFVDTLPLVFSIHCLGCSIQTMEFWSSIAEEYNFLWVNPEGVNKSFNAGDESCCGYALEEGIDDIGYLRFLIQELVQEFESDSSKTSAERTETKHQQPSLPLPQLHLSPAMVYAMGWSNGGYIVTAAASLFRAVVPISGFHVQQIWQPTSPLFLDKPRAVMFHHDVNDPMVRITGCCQNETYPACCCGISNHLHQCASLGDTAQQWASQVNHCGGTSSSNGKSAITKPQISYQAPDQVTCYTYEENSCQANTTYCIHQGKYHFNRPSFEMSFPMHTEIAQFFAQDACAFSSKKNTWNAETRICFCSQSNNKGKYCLVAGATATGHDKKQSIETNKQDSLEGNRDDDSKSMGLGFTVSIGLLMAVAMILQWWRQRRWRGRQLSGFSLVHNRDQDTLMEMAKLSDKIDEE